jgi:4-amino-4-deoxy-L-arabinose transferase-like glycosyltransferase
MSPTTSSALPIESMDETENKSRSSFPLLLKIFFVALAVRWVYALAIYAFMGDTGLKGVDSYTFAQFATDFADALRGGTPGPYDLLGGNPFTVPLFHWLAGLPFLILGDHFGTIGYVLLQGIFDAATAVIVFLIARQIAPRAAFAAAIFSIFNPTQIVMSGLFYADTPFTFFVAVTFLAALLWLKNQTSANSLLLGGAIGLAALVRSLIVPWGFAALAMLAIYGFFRRGGWRKTATLVFAFALLCVSTGLIFYKNYRLYGTAGLTSQGGIHLALSVVPLLKEMDDRTPAALTSADMENRTLNRFGPHPANPFEQSRQYSIIAREALVGISWTAIAKSWLSGATINLVAPAIVLSPPVSQIPRTGFFDTPGRSFFEKVRNYALNPGNALYSWLLLSGAAGLAATRLVQLFGFFVLVRQRTLWPLLFLIATWLGYLFLINGPIASPKYRLPLEPLFDIMSGAGFVAASIWLKGRKRKTTLANGT